jgi:hypothetical protein
MSKARDLADYARTISTVTTDDKVIVEILMTMGA